MGSYPRGERKAFLKSMSIDTPDLLGQPLFSGRKILLFCCAFILVVMCLSTGDVIYSLRKTAGRSDAVVSASERR
jgi:hypothetical protein